MNATDVTRWKCKDRRYLIKIKGSSDNTSDSVDAACQWNKTYTVTPSDLECVIAYCDNPTTDPNTNGLNYNFTWDQNVIPLNESLTYHCEEKHRHEGDWNNKISATNEVDVLCGDDGEFIYPDPWLQCSKTIVCPDPGNSAGVSRNYETRIKDFKYDSILKYTCDDKRKWIKHESSSDQLRAGRKTRCLWKKIYGDSDMTDLVCQMHHCRHPHDEPGSHQPPPTDHHLKLKSRSNWDVDFGTSITYECETGMHFENDEIDPTQDNIDVECINEVGEYNTPVRNGNVWPNCTETVLCGKPPDPPINGTRTWMSPASEDQETYNTHIVYTCQDGSQFDTDNDGRGDSVSVEIRCQWNKQWNPYTVLPPCLVTHCVEPFKIPPDSDLEELTSEWTSIYTYKHYQCKNSVDSIPTMFWETDRTKSTFKLFCNADGYFTWQDWPTCLTGKN